MSRQIMRRCTQACLGPHVTPVSHLRSPFWAGQIRRCATTAGEPPSPAPTTARTLSSSGLTDDQKAAAALRGATEHARSSSGLRTSSEHRSTPAAIASAIPLDTPEQVEAAFHASVEARTVSNAQLRRFIQQLPVNEYALALSAIKGAVTAGLQPNAMTYEALLEKLLHAGQLKASMEVYHEMLRLHLLPTPNIYALLMEMCIERDMQDSCQRLFNDMQKRGVQPSLRNYELMITSLAAEVPPRWERAVEVFDKITRHKNQPVSATTYNALMRVYLNIEPFDWRIVYNCYQDMRTREPAIPLQWESYRLLREALVRGKAGRVRRCLAYMDAWTAITPFRSANFIAGALAYLALVFAIKAVLSYVWVWYYDKLRGATADSVLPTM